MHRPTYTPVLCTGGGGKFFWGVFPLAKRAGKIFKVFFRERSERNFIFIGGVFTRDHLHASHVKTSSSQFSKM